METTTTAIVDFAGKKRIDSLFTEYSALKIQKDALEAKIKAVSDSLKDECLKHCKDGFKAGEKIKFFKDQASVSFNLIQVRKKSYDLPAIEEAFPNLESLARFDLKVALEKDLLPPDVVKTIEQRFMVYRPYYTRIDTAGYPSIEALQQVATSYFKDQLTTDFYRSKIKHQPLEEP